MLRIDVRDDPYRLIADVVREQLWAAQERLEKEKVIKPGPIWSGRSL